jgi:hypothetical protein
MDTGRKVFLQQMINDWNGLLEQEVITELNEKLEDWVTTADNLHKAEEPDTLE